PESGLDYLRPRHKGLSAPRIVTVALDRSRLLWRGFFAPGYNGRDEKGPGTSGPPSCIAVPVLRRIPLHADWQTRPHEYRNRGNCGVYTDVLVWWCITRGCLFLR